MAINAANSRPLRIMCAVSAWPSHWFPLVPVLWALRAAGHEVRVACAPSQATPLTRAGLSPAPVLTELDMTFLARLRNVLDAQAGLWPYDWLPPHPVTSEPMRDLAEFGYADFAKASQQKIATPVARSGKAAVAFAESYRPDLVLLEPLAMEGLAAARTLGVPDAVHLWGPIGSAETDKDAKAVVEYPVTSFPGCRAAGTVTLDSVEHVIDPCPADLAPAVGARNRLPMRYVPYNGPGFASAAPAGDRPKVCVVWGNSLSVTHGPRAFAVPAILDGLTGLDADVVVVTGARDRLPADLGPGVTVLSEVPLHLLLPGCAAVIHHGGAGCLMTAVSAGVPQVVLPTGMDQPVNAARLAATGAAIAIPRSLATPSAIRTAVDTVLQEPGYAAAATKLARQCAERPTPADVAADLADLARASR